MPGDIVVFYTDGVTETENPFGEQFGIERLSEAVRRNPSLSAQELRNNIYGATSNFCSDDFNDDVTILVVKCNFDDGGKSQDRRSNSNRQEYGLPSHG